MSQAPLVNYETSTLDNSCRYP